MKYLSIYVILLLRLSYLWNHFKVLLCLWIIILLKLLIKNELFAFLFHYGERVLVQFRIVTSFAATVAEQ